MDDSGENTNIPFKVLAVFGLISLMLVPQAHGLRTPLSFDLDVSVERGTEKMILHLRCQKAAPIYRLSRGSFFREFILPSACKIWVHLRTFSGLF